MDSRIVSAFNKAVGAPSETLFVGIHSNPKARKYIYTLLYYNSVHDFCFETPRNEQIEEANTRMCETHSEVYAYAFEAIKDTLNVNPDTHIVIVDLTDGYEE